MKFKDLTALLIRLSVGFILFSAGFSKLAPEQIGNLIGPVYIPFGGDSTILTAVWYFVALVEILAGALLLSQQYSMPGLLLSYFTFVGILLFTIITGFGLTILINVFLLLLLSIEVVYTWPYIRKISPSDYSTFFKSRGAELFPVKKLAVTGSVLTVLAIPLSLTDGVFVNIVVSMAVVFYIVNLFSGITGFIGKLFITMFFIISLSVVNGLYLLAFIPNLIYLIFGLIGLGLAVYIIIATIALFNNFKPTLRNYGTRT